MRVRLAVILAALWISSACAHAQPVDGDAPTSEDIAEASALEPYRGHRPFAAAKLSPFGKPGWFVASFFHYWTGYGAAAEEHWSIRYVHGDRAYTDWDKGREIAATPAVTQWADSQTCPALGAAVARFNLSASTPFAPQTFRPAAPGGPIVFSAYDATTLSFWARLSGPGASTEVSLSEPYNESAGVSLWLRDTLASVAPCLSATPPLIPLQDLPPPEPTQDLFGQP